MVNSTVTSLILAVKSTFLDQEKAKPIFDTFLELEPTLIDTPSSVLDGFDKVVKASKDDLDKETIKDTLGWLGGVSAKADHKKDPTVSKVKWHLYFLFYIFCPPSFLLTVSSYQLNLVSLIFIAMSTTSHFLLTSLSHNISDKLLFVYSN